MALDVKISGVSYKALDDYSIKQQAGAIATTTVGVKLNGLPVPQAGERVTLILNSVTIFGGLIKSVETAEFNTGYEPQVYRLTVQSWEVALTYRLVTGTWYSKTYLQIITDIFNGIIIEENFTLGSISTTATVIPKYDVKDRTVYDVLSDIAAKIGPSNFWITPAKVFYFQTAADFASTSLPTKMTGLRMVTDLSDMRTVQRVRGASSRIVATATDSGRIATLAGLSGLSGKIEGIVQDTTLKTTASAGTKATEELTARALREQTVSVTCHDLTKTTPNLTWTISRSDLGISGAFVVTERTITHRVGNEVNIQVSLKNRNYFARYGYSIKAIAQNADFSTDRISDMDSDEMLSPVEKATVRTRWDAIVAERPALIASGLTALVATYEAAFQALANILNDGATWTAGLPTWITADQMATYQPINTATWDPAWTGYVVAKDNLISGIASNTAIEATKQTAPLIGPIASWPMSDAPALPDNSAGIAYVKSSWSSLDSWSASNATTAFIGGSLELTLTANDPNISRTFSFLGGTNRFIYIRMRQTSGAVETSAVKVYWSTGGHGISESYQISDVKGINAYGPIGTWFTVALDMFTATGSSDWIANTITELRLDIPNGGTAGQKYEVGAIYIGDGTCASKNVTYADDFSSGVGTWTVGGAGGPAPTVTAGVLSWSKTNASSFLSRPSTPVKKGQTIRVRGRISAGTPGSATINVWIGAFDIGATVTTAGSWFTALCVAPGDGNGNFGIYIRPYAGTETYTLQLDYIDISDSLYGPLADSSGNGRTLSLQPGAVRVPGPAGRSAISLASAGYGAIATTPNLGLDGASFSVSRWVYRTGSPTQDNYLTLAGAIATRQYLYFGVRGTGSLGYVRFGFYGDDLDSTSAIPADQWVRITGTFNVSTLVQKLYINGVLNNSRTAGGALTNTNGANLTVISGVNAAGFGASAYDQIYNRVLTDAEELWLYANPGATLPGESQIITATVAPRYRGSVIPTNPNEGDWYLDRTGLQCVIRGWTRNSGWFVDGDKGHHGAALDDILAHIGASSSNLPPPNWTFFPNLMSDKALIRELAVKELSSANASSYGGAGTSKMLVNLNGAVDRKFIRNTANNADTVIESGRNGFAIVSYADASVAATAMVSGNWYQILSVGTTVWTSFGALFGTVGETFIANGAGTGTGTVKLGTTKFTADKDGNARLTGNIIGGSRYNSSGALLDANADGYFLGSDGAGKMAGMTFEGTRGGGVQWGSPIVLARSAVVLSAGDVYNNSICSIENSVVIASKATSSTLQAYKSYGDTFTAVGSTYAVSGIMCDMGNSRIAVLSTTGGLFTLRILLFTGSGFSQVGNTLSNPVAYATYNFKGIIPIGDDSFVVLWDHATSGSDLLQSYHFDGTNITAQGSSTTIGTGSRYSIARMSRTSFCVWSGTASNLIVYSYNPSSGNITAGPNTYTLSSTGWNGMSMLNATDLFYIDCQVGEISILRWNGSTWTKVSSAGSSGTTGRLVSVSTVDGSSIVYADTDEGKLVRIGLSFALSAPPKAGL